MTWEGILRKVRSSWEGTFLIGGIGLGLQRWELDSWGGPTLILKKVLREGPAFSTVACVNVLSYHIDFFIFKSFVPVLPIEGDLVITQDSCLTAVVLQFIHQLHSPFLSLYFLLVLQAPPPEFSPNSQKCTLAPEVFLESFLRKRESDSRSGDNLLLLLRGSVYLSREEKLQENRLGPR